MHWMARSATAAVLALALAALPLVLDQCAAACAAHEAAVASTPACHHASPVKNQVGRTPAPCGHDHRGPVVTAESRPAAPLLGLDSMVAVLVIPAALTPTAADRPVLTHAPPGASLTPDTRSLPLRI